MVKILFGSGVSSHKEYGAFLDVVKTAVENGCRGFDTAPSYRTEGVLGKAVRACAEEFCMKREDFFIQSKIDAWQMQESDGDIAAFAERALRDMGLKRFDAFLIHWPIEPFMEKTWRSMCALRERGLAGAIGICNVRVRHLEKFRALGIVPEMVQIERHPLMTFPREVEYCKANGIGIQAYSPLCKMHPHLRDSEVLREISERRGKSIGQIILRWHIDTGVAPVFTSRKPARIREYLNIFDFSLSEAEIGAISSLNENYKLCLESVGCPGF